MHINSYLYRMFCKKFYFALVCLFCCSQSIGQQTTQNGKGSKVHLKKKIISAKFDDVIRESSGLIYFDRGLWTLNDGGNPPLLYKIDTTSGKILRRVFVCNAMNNDWEALTQDDSFVYIGDFGNNSGSRRDLVILKISKKDMERDTVRAGLIQFSYAGQNNFQLPFNKHNFDCEAFCSAGDSLYLFSKNWVDRKTTMYALSKFPGIYSISSVDSFDIKGLITDADYDEVNRTLVLMGYDIKKISVHSFIWVFRDFNKTSFFSGKAQKLNLHLFVRQNEAIAHIRTGNYYFTNEFFKRRIFCSRSKLFGLKLSIR